MIKLRLKDEDLFASIGEGGSSCCIFPLKKFPLETLLETAPDYVVKGIDTAEI